MKRTQSIVEANKTLEIVGLEHAGARLGLGLTSVGGPSIRDGALPAAAHVPAAAGSIFGVAQLSILDVLLLYPEFPDTFWSFKHALKFIHKRASLPPLGLLTVAAMLPGSWAKRLVDVNVRTLREEDLAWADLVFVSGMIAQRDSARELIARCRAAGKTIVAGGPISLEWREKPDYRASPRPVCKVHDVAMAPVQVALLLRSVSRTPGGPRTLQIAWIEQVGTPGLRLARD